MNGGYCYDLYLATHLRTTFSGLQHPRTTSYYISRPSASLLPPRFPLHHRRIPLSDFTILVSPLLPPPRPSRAFRDPLQDSLRPLRLLRQPSITYLRACGLTLGEYGGLSNYDVIAQLRSPSRSFHRLTVDSAMTHPPRTLAAHSSTLEGI